MRRACRNENVEREKGQIKVGPMEPVRSCEYENPEAGKTCHGTNGPVQTL